MTTDDEFVVTPSARRLFFPAAWRALLAIALITINLSDPDRLQVVPAVIAAVWLVLAVVVGRTALRRLRTPVLVIDRDGLRLPDGDVRRGWADVVAVWVREPRLLPALRPLELRLHTRSGVHFAERAGSRVHARGAYSLPTDRPAAEIAAAISTLTRIPTEHGRNPANVLRDAGSMNP